MTKLIHPQRRAITVLSASGTADNVQINAALASAGNGGVVHLRDGTYVLAAALTVPAGVVLEGSGITTVLNIAALTGSSSVSVGANAQLKNLKVVGDNSTLKSFQTGRIVMGSGSLAENVWIDDAAYGFETAGAAGVRLRNVHASDLRDNEGQAAFVHGDATGSGVYVDGFSVTDCDRAFEPEDGASLWRVENGTCANIYPTADGRTIPDYSYVVGGHSHAGEATTRDLVYRNITLTNCYQLTAYGTATSLVEDVLFENIRIVNPWTNSAGSNAALGSDYAKNIVYRNVTVSVAGTQSLPVRNCTDITFDGFRVPSSVLVVFDFTGTVGINFTGSTRFDQHPTDALVASNGSTCLVNCIAGSKYHIGDGTTFAGIRSVHGLFFSTNTSTDVAIDGARFVVSGSAPGGRWLKLNVTDGRVTNSDFRGNPSGQGIDLETSTGVQVYGNTIENKGIIVRSDVTGAAIGNNRLLNSGTVSMQGTGRVSYDATVATTNATATTILALQAPANKIVSFSGIVTARRTGGTGGTADDAALYDVKFAMKNVGGTATLVGSASITAVAEDQAAWDVTLVASSATMLVKVTGAADNNIDWQIVGESVVVA